MQVCSPVLLARPCGLLPEREQKEEAPSESAPGGGFEGETLVHGCICISGKASRWTGLADSGCLYPPEIFRGPEPSPPTLGGFPEPAGGEPHLACVSGPFRLQLQVPVCLPGDGAPRGRMLMTHGWLPPLCPPSHSRAVLSLLCRWKRRERGWRAGDTAWARGILSGVLYLLSDPSPISVLRLGPRGLRCRKAGAGTSLRKQTEAPLVPEQQHSGHGASGSPCLWAHGNCLLSLQ